MMGLPFALCLSLVSVAGASAGLSCKSDTGEDVDFAYGFKFPNGYDYAYMDAHQSLAKSTHTLNSSSSFVMATLAQMGTYRGISGQVAEPLQTVDSGSSFLSGILARLGISGQVVERPQAGYSSSNDLEDSGASGVSYLLWNDQPPPKKSVGAPMAHAKGGLVFTDEGGVWLTHSWPHFPTVGEGTNFWQDASDYFGQSFLCITIEASEIHKLAPVLAINRPVIYDSNIADENEFSDLKALVDGNWNDQTMTTQVEITSRGGVSFTVFGKSGNWGAGKDLYHDLVGKTLGALKMEGWRRGAGVWGPACSDPQVLNVLSVNFPSQSWHTTSDHSKWAITQSSDNAALCVGDLNRADGQDERGGGTVCIHDAVFQAQIANVVNSTDSCSD